MDGLSDHPVNPSDLRFYQKGNIRSRQTVVTNQYFVGYEISEWREMGMDHTMAMHPSNRS